MHREINSDKSTIIIYHENCRDGLACHWIANRKFGETADYFPLENGDTLSISGSNKNVFMLDIVAGNDDLNEINRLHNLTVIDHHESNGRRIDGIDNKVFDLSRSGAGISWSYFFPDEEMPLAIKYIQDRDLWHWKLEFSREISAYVATLSFNIDEFNKFCVGMEQENIFKEFVRTGERIISYNNVLIDKVIDKSAVEVELDGHRCFAANSSFLVNDVAEKLYADKYPFAIVWFYMGGKIRVSLRSRPGSNFNVARLAEKYGGGGHDGSAGFILNSFEDIPWRIIRNNNE